MKQTAVEWLEIQLKKGIDYNPLDLSGYTKAVDKLFEDAKAMEKQHVMEFLEEYDSYIFRGGDTSEEEYYNYIYGQ
jgi:hypothetical protein